MSEQRIGRYTLIREIARGGMADIWLAEQRGPGGFNKELVIKRILPHLAEEAQMTEMFLDEARLVAELTHPNIGQVFELGEAEGDYYIAMEYIDGLNLAQLLQKMRTGRIVMPVEYAARIVCDVLVALDYAHNYVNREGEAVRLVHRDISPHNVILSNDGVVKLVDFGVAKAKNQSHKTESGAVKGKFAYMAPEQIENKELDGRVDVFAVGVLFYELLTGQKPFGDDLKAISMILSEVSPDPREARNDLPDDVVRIIAKALERDREKRYQSASEMEAELQRFLQRNSTSIRTRDLSRLARQIQNLSSGCRTGQLFGFEKQGVDLARPRLTVREISVEGAAVHAPGPAEQPVVNRQETLVGLTGSEETKSMTAALSAEAASEGMSLKWIFAFIGLVLTVLVTAGTLFVMLVFDEGKSGSPMSSEEATASVIDEGEREEPSADDERSSATATWRHHDGLVVVISANEVADVYRADQRIGATPYQTLLRPGRYFLELRRGERVESVEIEVEEGSGFQQFRFEL